MTRWLDVGLKYEGTAEVPGPGSNPVVLGWIHAHGRPDARDDSTIAWCGFGMAGWFTEAGHAAVVPKDPGAAKNWRTVGEALAGPKVGAIIVIPRHDPHNPDAAHVGLIEDFDERHIRILAANQGNRVSVETIERRDRIYTYRWPIRTATAVELAASDAAGEPNSRIAAAARAQKRDAAKSGAAGSASQVPAAPPRTGLREAVDGWLGNASSFKSSVQTAADFLGFVGSRWQWVALAVAAYFFLRMTWNGHRIQLWRTQDHNEGYTS